MQVEVRRGSYLYQTYHSIIQRCTNPKRDAYKNYGGHGISMYPAWVDDFEVFKSWILSNIGARPENGMLDRIDNDKNYEPGNLKWSTRSEQNSNKRSNVEHKHVYPQGNGYRVTYEGKYVGFSLDLNTAIAMRDKAIKEN